VCGATAFVFRDLTLRGFWLVNWSSALERSWSFREGELGPERAHCIPELSTATSRFVRVKALARSCTGPRLRVANAVVTGDAGDRARRSWGQLFERRTAPTADVWSARQGSEQRHLSW
jgi:hypothetical protein